MERNPQDIRQAARVFKALSHPGRLEVACHLSQDGPQTQKQLVSAMGCPQSTMARHLGALRDLGLVIGERRGPEVLLKVSSEVISQIVQALCDWMHEEQETRPRESA